VYGADIADRLPDLRGRSVDREFLSNRSHG
jgi:hypothetical protein